MNFEKVKWIFVLVLGLPSLLVCVIAIVSFECGKAKDMIVFDNRLASPVDVLVDGRTVESLDPAGTYGATHLVKLPSGARQVSVRLRGRELAAAALNLSRPPGEKRGYRGLFCVGPAPTYVLATVPYAARGEPIAESPTLSPIPPPTPLTELPRDLEEYEISRIDTPFLQSERSYAKAVRKRQLCRLGDDGSIGCSGFALEGVFVNPPSRHGFDAPRGPGPRRSTDTRRG